MNKKCLFAIGALLLVIVGGAYKFLIQGSVSHSSDGRMAIHMNAAERDLVLAEMRAFLLGVQQITQGVTSDDMVLVATAATAVGQAAQAGVPVALMGKLPIAFKKLGLDTHQQFDLLALDAESIGDGQHTLEQLAKLMENCVACHAAHRIEVTEN